MQQNHVVLNELNNLNLFLRSGLFPACPDLTTSVY